MGLKRFRSLASLAVLLLPIAVAHAAIVDYTASSLGGNVWRYDYTIRNTTPGIEFDELTIYFDVGNYGTLSAMSAPTGWDPIVIQPDLGIPSDGFYDAVSLGGFVGDGANISLFSVNVQWLGIGAPGEQSYELIDSSTFRVVASGRTTQAPASPQGVPEPSSIALLSAALGVLVTSRRQRVGLQ